MNNLPLDKDQQQQKSVNKVNRIIVTIAIYGANNFVITQTEYEFQNSEELQRATLHYSGDLFRKNIEAGGAFVKVDVYTV